MIEVRRGVRHILKHDPILASLIGRDDDGTPKVYPFPAKSNVKAPYVTYQLTPGETPEGTYKDGESIEVRNILVTSWGRDGNEAWQIFGAVREAFEHGDMATELLPYSLLMIRRRGDETELPDEDTGWVQVPCTYAIGISR